MPRKIRRFLPVVAAAALATSGFAYMDNNAVDPSNAGQGSAAISGYSVTNIHYTETSDNLATVSFTLTATNPPNTPHTPTVYAEVGYGGTPAGSEQDTCTMTSASWTGTGTFSCTSASHPSLHDINNLSVIAYQ